MITEERLKGAYSEGEALAIYNEVKQSGDLIGFCRTYMNHEDYQVARNALWGVTKASKAEHTQLQPLLHPLIDLAMQTDNASVRRLSLHHIERLKLEEDDLRTDFLDFCLAHMVNPDEFPSIQSRCHRDRSTTSRIIHWQMSQGQVIDIMTFNPYSLQYYSFWKGKIGFARTVPVSWPTPMSIASVTVDS